MSTIQQNEDPTPTEKLSAINFTVTEDFKLAVDLAVTKQRTTLREFCTRVIAEALGIPVPGEEPAAQPDAPARKRRAG